MASKTVSKMSLSVGEKVIEIPIGGGGGSGVATTANGSELVIKTDKNPSGYEYILPVEKSDLKVQVLENGAGENSLVISNGNAISENTIAAGREDGINSIAGCKGFYYYSAGVSFLELSLSQGKKSWNDQAQAILEGWLNKSINLVGSHKHTMCSKVLVIESGGMVEIDSSPFGKQIPFTEAGTTYQAINWDTLADPDWDDGAVYCPELPEAGLIEFGQGAKSIGAASNAIGTYSVAEGKQTLAANDYAHAEGRWTKAGYASHAEGYTTSAIGQGAHSEGHNTTASAHSSHAEGNSSVASGAGAHAEGAGTKATELAAHSEGNATTASGGDSHAEGLGTIASGAHAHAEGRNTKSTGNSSHAEGQETSAEEAGAHAEGIETHSYAAGAHAEGTSTTASAISAHAEGEGTSATSGASHAEGKNSTASGFGSHAEGGGNEATNEYSHAEGYITKAINKYAHAEGDHTLAEGVSSHAEGSNTIASGNFSHVEGIRNSDVKGAVGTASHVEGANGEANGNYSHVEGLNCKTKAGASGSHAEGEWTEANAQYSHAEGWHTITDERCGHVQGKYNKSKSGYAHVVGNGSEKVPSDAHTIDWNGNAWFAGDITTGNNNKKVVTEEYVESALQNRLNNALNNYRFISINNMSHIDPFQNILISIESKHDNSDQEDIIEDIRIGPMSQQLGLQLHEGDNFINLAALYYEEYSSYPDNPSFFEWNIYSDFDNTIVVNVYIAQKINTDNIAFYPNAKQEKTYLDFTGLTKDNIYITKDMYENGLYIEGEIQGTLYLEPLRIGNNFDKKSEPLTLKITNENKRINLLNQISFKYPLDKCIYYFASSGEIPELKNYDDSSASGLKFYYYKSIPSYTKSTPITLEIEWDDSSLGTSTFTLMGIE